MSKCVSRVAKLSESGEVSPLLFILAIEFVFRQVGPDVHAATLNGMTVPQLGFADDLIFLSIGEIHDAQRRFDAVNDALKGVGLRFSPKRGKCVLMHGGPPQPITKPTAADITALKLKHTYS